MRITVPDKEQILNLLFSYKCHEKKMIPYFLSIVVVVFFFPALTVGLSMNLEDSLGEEDLGG